MRYARGSIIESIDKKKLCLGCGLCESICGKDSVGMQLNDDGFFHPKVKVIKQERELIIKRVCPGINVVNDQTFRKTESIWGKIEQIYKGKSTDPEIQLMGSSGGVISGLAIYLLEKKIVDGILQVGGDVNDYKRNQLKISKTRKDVLDCASSRYAPAIIFNSILELFKENTSTYCFIGKPCDITALKNVLNEFPEFKNRIRLTIAIICAGIPSFTATQKIIESFNPLPPVKKLRYRGNGWPGYFSFVDANEKTYKMSYNDSWGKVLGKHVYQRCKICPDGIGIQADIAIGDAWETTNGYPDFTEREGQSLILARTLNGNAFLSDAVRSNSLNMEIQNIGLLKLMQPYQYSRRLRVGTRIIAFSIVNGNLLNFKGLTIYRNMLKLPILAIIREFMGSLKRFIRLRFAK